ncbi:MAG: class III signal peptide-containing protein [Methanobacterium sp. ERen5]|nr:MAG: class III signal peptide-containing protein [Methanobacterium sp. ERen5]
MGIIDDISGQGAAEYILLFGGVIVVAVAALLIYSNYFNPGINPYRASSDINHVRSSVNNS